MCDPATCENGKCRATGECVERMRPAVEKWLEDTTVQATLERRPNQSSGVDMIRDMSPEELANWNDDGNCNAGQVAAPRQRLIDADSATRKTFPMARGLLDYFPDALAAVAQVSFIGNEKHNPGEEMHHARWKSTDHADCILRHLVGRGGFDGDTRHSAALAWRALALLQEELEREMGLSLPRGARGARAA